MSVSREESRRRWQERLARFAASQLTVAQFCAQESISAASFYQWRRRSRAAVPDVASQRRRQAVIPRFLPLAFDASTEAWGQGRSLDLELPNHVRLRLPHDIGAPFVGELLRMMAELGPDGLRPAAPAEVR